MNLVFNQATRHPMHDVSLYAFGYMKDTIEYRIIHVGWDGPGFSEPAAIPVFSLQDKDFYHSNIPREAKSSYHSLTRLNEGVGFISAEIVGYDTNILLWAVLPQHQNKFIWQKKARFGNDRERTKVLLSRLKYFFVRREDLMHWTWDEHVEVFKEGELTLDMETL
ncbi:uncharacterized protein DS421_19g647320 [Arachis hypogaea]|uniref:Uncharacterized protein n=1 Tax=Arachis hypogaea TaxID=3818 RepID=A0A6B9V5K1_ARAHY|nr:uncharacterized protein DS421_19g647320 [Arachis hypogaea]